MKTGGFRRCEGICPQRVVPGLLRSLTFCILLLSSAATPSARSAPSSSAPSFSSSPLPVLEGTDGWLFLRSELRFLELKKFWGTVPKPHAGPNSPMVAKGDPLEAIADFDTQLKAAGVRLILMPVPPKALISNCAPPGIRSSPGADALGVFYMELANRGVEVLDLRPAFAAREASGEAMYCKTDSHWSGRGCVVAAQILAERLRPLLPSSPRAFVETWQETAISGDLSQMRGTTTQAPTESLSIRRVSNANGDPLPPVPTSPLLLLGDSHTLVFRDFLAEASGLADQLAFETGTIPEVIGTRGSGANAVRVSLFRRNLKDAGYLPSKKVLVWCFAAREFTEADQGWQLIPIKRPEAKSK